MGSDRLKISFEGEASSRDKVTKYPYDINSLKHDILDETSDLSKVPDDLQALWDDRLLIDEPEDDTPLLFINKIPILIEGNHTLILGKKKSRKTLFLVWQIAQSNESVLYFDTEQGRKHAWNIRNKVKQISGHELPVFFLRGMSPKDRRDFIYQTLLHWKKKPKYIVIDGIRDLMNNINDPVESTDLIVWLEAIIKEFDVSILNVLHTNKNDNNARGHIGTELGNKCYMVIEIEKDHQTGVSLCKCADSRDEPFETFAFQHDPVGLPEIVSVPVKGKVLSEDQERELLNHVFDGEVLSYKDMIEEMQAHFAVGRNKAVALSALYQRKKWIVKSGSARSKDTRYKLMIN